MSGGPTIYAALLDQRTDEPRQRILEEVERISRSTWAPLATFLVDELRNAYVAGVTDGFAQGVAAAEVQTRRDET